jgi:hypothetical protein
MLYGNDDVQDDIDSILLNLVASNIPKWPTFKLMRWCKFSTDLWIWMKLCMEVMQFKIHHHHMALQSNTGPASPYGVS